MKSINRLFRYDEKLESNSYFDFNNQVYSTVIPRNVRLSEAPSHGVPVLIYDKNCPGSISYFNFTEEFINQELYESKDEKMLINKIPSGDLGTGDDVSNCVAFLASDSSNYINGETIHVNGGMYMA